MPSSKDRESRQSLIALFSALLCSCLSQQGWADTPAFNQQAFSLPASAESLVVADLNGDGLNDLSTLVDDRLRIYFQSTDGFDFSADFADIQFEARAVGWDLSSGFSSNGSTTVIALLDGKQAVYYPIADRSVLEPEIIKSDLPGFISSGVNRLHFARDINADGMQDLVIPGAGEISILINDSGNFEPPLSVRSEVRLRTQLNINRFNRSAGQTIRIPLLDLRDVNADGNADLVSRTDEKLDVFLAAAGSSYFPASPSYSLDIAAIEERLGDFDIDTLDFSNLTGVLALTHEEILEDIDGDGIHDLLLREGGKVSFFGGNATGMDLEQPRQVLRSGGNVLSTFVYDENEDGLKDLWLWRVEPISVGDIFVWLALSGSVAIEAFVYPNDGERFARRPSRKVTVDLKFPSVMRLANAYENLNSELEGAQDQGIARTTEADLEGSLEDDDLVVLVNNQIQVFLNSIEPSQDQEFLGTLGYSRSRDNYEIDIREILDNVALNGDPNLDAARSQSAAVSIDLGSNISNGDLVAAQINSDQLDDIIVFTGFDASQIQGILLLSK
jgi:hypothetical protein